MTLYSNWSEVNKLIDRALELEKEKRIDFLEEKCGENSKLLAEAKDYLSHIEQAEQDDSFLESKTIGGSKLYRQLHAEGLTGNGLSPVIGREIGHYKIMKELGEGGMGSVYLAERSDGEFEQQVAIKFLRGYYSPSMRDRFKREKQILARLNHPNIAGLLDGGIADDGTPYMIMEYVEGKPVDKYCRHHSLKLNKRLDLFLQICRAVQHAHSKLIIHRDLKPENIFITADGQVKVMDFGIGKFLNSELDDESLLHTREGHHVASVEFAAPEQFQSGDPSTATDVYGLGVLLYLLLTGEKPFVLKGKSLTEIEKLVQHKPPPHPSSHSNPTIGAIQADLEAIILKALRKEPEQRYETVREFSDDLQRFISHQPVLARKGSTLYKTRKFLFRNKGTLVPAVFVLIMLGGFLLYHLQTMNHQMEQTQLEAETARSVTDFIVDLFDISDPIENEDRILTAAALLERGQLRFDNLDINPDVQLELLGSLGKASMQLGDYKNAIHIYSKADSLAKVFFEENTYQSAATALNLGIIYTSHRFFTQGEEHLKRALPFFEQNNDQHRQEYVELLLQLGTCLQNTDRREEAINVFGKGLELSRIVDHKSRKTLTFELKLGQVHRTLGQYETAEKIYASLLENIENYGYQRYDIYRLTLNSHGHLYRALDDHPKAYYYFNTAVNDAISIYGRLHPHTLNLKHNLMMQYVYQKDYEKAIEAGHEMMEAYTIRHTDYSLMTSKAHIKMGTIYYASGDFNNAKHHFEKSYSMVKDIKGSRHHRTAMAQLNLSFCLIQEGQIVEGNELFNTAVSILESPDLEFDFLASDEMRRDLPLFEEHTNENLAPKFERVRQIQYDSEI
jgi:eukaryotic-like serine/threonine-protein kinase